MSEKKDIHLLYCELSEKYSYYHETMSSLIQIRTTDINEIQQNYQVFKKKFLDTKVLAINRFQLAILRACMYNNRYLRSYWAIFKMSYEDFHAIPDLREFPIFQYFFNQEYGLPVSMRDQMKYENYSLDVHGKNTIFKSIMEDDKDSFIVFVEDESFDKDQLLISELYPESKEGYSLLELCCYHGAVDCFKILRTKFNPEITPKCLEFSFLSGKPDIVSECLKYQKPDDECMKCAIISFNIDFVTFLNSEYGLEIQLDECRRYFNIQAFLVYLDITKDIDNCFIFSLFFSPSMIDYFISQIDDIDVKDKELQATALIVASLLGYFDIVKLLVSLGAKLNLQDKFGFTALHYAAKYNSIEIMEFLISHNAEINLKNSFGDTALHTAVRFGSKETLEFLISHGAQLNIKNDDGETAFMHAVKFQSIDSATFLFNQGANINEKDKMGYTALHNAAGYNNTEVVKLLLSLGANVNSKSNNGETPLSCAAYMNCIDAAEILLSHNADVNSKDKHDFSALDIAISNNCKEFIKLVLSSRANIEESIIEHATLLANSRNNEDIKELLQTYYIKDMTQKKSDVD